MGSKENLIGIDISSISLIDRQKLTELLGIKDSGQLSEYHRNWVEEVLKNGSNQRDAKWTEAIAVGDKEFVMETKAKLGAKALGRRELEKIMKDMSLRNPQVLTTLFLTLKSAA